MRPPARRNRVLAREPDRPFETAYPASRGRAISRLLRALLDDREPDDAALRMQLDDRGVLTLPVRRLGPPVRQDLVRDASEIDLSPAGFDDEGAVAAQPDVDVAVQARHDDMA